MTISFKPLNLLIKLQFGNQEQNPFPPHVEFPLDEEGKDWFSMHSLRDKLSPEELSAIKTADGQGVEQIAALKPGQKVYYIDQNSLPTWIIGNEDAETATRGIMKDKLPELTRTVNKDTEIRKRDFLPIPILYS